MNHELIDNACKIFYKMQYDEPGVKVLKKFGFKPAGIVGFYRTTFKPGVSSVMIFLNGEVSLYEECNGECDEEEAELFRLDKVHVTNDRQLECVLQASLT